MRDIHPALAAATRYLCEGYAAIPVPVGKKGPQLPAWQEMRLGIGDLDRHFGTGGNVGLLTGAPSHGLIDVDLDSPEARQLAPLFLPPTDRVCGRPGSPSSHWFYRCDPPPEPAKFADPIKRPDGRSMLVELRSTGQQTIVPPSLHPSGELVVWEKDGAPADGDGRVLRQQTGRLGAAAELARHWPGEGGRHATALALGGALAHAGWDEDDAAGFVEALLTATDDPETGDRLAAVRSSFAAVATDQRATGLPTLATLLPKAVVDAVVGWLELRDLSMLRELDRLVAAPIAANGTSGLRTHPATDLGNGERFADQHRGEARYSFRRSLWFVWAGTHWEQDEMGRAQQMASETVRAIYREAADAADPADRKALAGWARNSEGQARRDAMLRSAAPFLPVNEQQFDADPWLLNCKNGTLDLRTATLRPHRPEDLLTQRCEAAYVPGAPCPAWHAFLDLVMPGKPEMVAYLQRAAGYTLTGRSTEDVLFFCYGMGRNGKSTFINAIRTMLAGYGMQASTELILAKSVQAHPTERASLYRKRLVSTIESGQAKKLDEQLVKQLTGGDAIRARRMREDEWEFEPTHKLWLAANHKPIIRGNDTGIWARIKLIPFEVRIPDELMDGDIDDKLARERDGILAWAVEGCLSWQREGLHDPPAVQAATRAYRAEMDILADFLDDCCAMEPHATVTAKALYDAYALWCVDSGEQAMHQRLFGTCLGERGFLRCAIGHEKTRGYRGIRLLHAPGSP